MILIGLGLHLQTYFEYASSEGQASLHICAGMSVPSLLAYAISTKNMGRSVNQILYRMCMYM